MHICKIRNDFPILKTKINNHPLIYLDNASTTQKPQIVIDALIKYYTENNANIHRGVHYLSELSTIAYEKARSKVQKFINAPSATNCIFVRGTTEAINLVAHSYGNKFINENDEIVISAMEHHSNIVPWQLLCERNKAKLKIIPINLKGELDLTNLDQLLTDRTKLLAITHVSNSLGTINPVKQIIQIAHAKNIPVLIDGAQAAAHLKIDVQDLDCDFYALSSHKMYGPMGIGILYGKQHWLEQMLPYQSGGDMILQVTLEKSIYNDLPYKFEAGTPAVAEAIAFGMAIEYLQKLDQKFIYQHEKNLLEYALNKLSELPNISFIGQAQHKVGIISFKFDNIHPHDIGSIVNQYGIAIRTGHHCTMPVMNFFKVPATARVSFAIYNTQQEIDQLFDALLIVVKMFKKNR